MLKGFILGFSVCLLLAATKAHMFSTKTDLELAEIGIKNLSEEEKLKLDKWVRSIVKKILNPESTALNYIEKNVLFSSVEEYMNTKFKKAEIETLTVKGKDYILVTISDITGTKYLIEKSFINLPSLNGSFWVDEGFTRIEKIVLNDGTIFSPSYLNDQKILKK